MREPRFLRSLKHALGGALEPQVAPLGPDPLDLNEASLESLQGLPGVSKARAEEIIKMRPWSHPLELTAIRGISERMVTEWAEKGLIK